MKSVGIVGGSVIGLSTASAILQNNPNLKIVVYSDAFTPHTTADVSAGIILLGRQLLRWNENNETLKKWMKETVEYLVEFALQNDDASGVVTPLSGYLLWKRKPEEIINDFPDCVTGWREVGQAELDRISTPGLYSYGVFCTAMLCYCTKYLQCLMKNLAAQGVTFVQKKILSLDEVADLGHDIVINTTGYFAKELTDDPELQPIRGQILIARGPWIKHFFIDMESQNYIYPKSDFLVVGVKNDAGSSLTIRKDASDKIWKDAHLMVPNLKGSNLIGERVGIRPGRSSVRIDIEQAVTTKSLKKYVILHHYGHSGYGVALHWGSAKQAASLLQQYLDQNSKL